MDHAERLRTLEESFREPTRLGLVHKTADDTPLDGRVVSFDGRPVVNFGSCSYLGLETDDRLREGVYSATARYGTQFSSSRAYASAPPYRALEERLEAMFGGPVVIAASTTLGHLTALPVLVGQQDAVILDQQAHHSVKVAVNQVRLQGARVEVVRHNRLDLLEERIEALRRAHPRIWYMADGVYSMYADMAPADQLQALLEKYEQLRLYVDDSHGVSWTGPHGRGYVRSRIPWHDRVYLACSLNKGFAAAGAALVFPDAEQKRLVMTCGGPMIFSGPIQPPMLGAALASAAIHLSDELPALQSRLAAKVRLFNRLAADLGVPVTSRSEVPIRTVPLGVPRAAFAMTRRLLDEGLFTNAAAFPAVPVKQAGVRASLTLHHSDEDITRLVRTIARNLPEVMREASTDRSDIARAFHLAIPTEAPGPDPALGGATEPGLRVQHETTIAALDAREWDLLVGRHGTFTASTLAIYERAFRRNPKPEDNWTWHYFLVRDGAGRPVAASFFTEALWKDDMLVDARVSERVEERRRNDEYYLTSQTLAMGSLITEGDHLYLDRSRDWRQALGAMLDAVAGVENESRASTLVLRDIRDADAELGEYLRDAGFVKVGLPDSHVLDVDFATDQEFLAGLPHKARYHQRRKVLPFDPLVSLEVRRGGPGAVTAGELDHFYRLYRNVHARGLDLNTFPLPRRLFDEIAVSPDWELLLLHACDEDGAAARRDPVAFGAALVAHDLYCPVLIGLDYEFVSSHAIYRQMLRGSVRRAIARRCRAIQWGMGARLEKRRFGARAERRSAWVQAADHYGAEVLEQLSAEARAADGDDSRPRPESATARAYRRR